MTEDEARDQFALWSSKAREARESSERYDRLAKGYDRMVEGLRLIFPDVAGPEHPNPMGFDITLRQTVATVNAALAAAMPHQEIVRTQDAVLAVLADLGDEDGYVPSRTIAQKIQARGWRLDTDEPETVIRKYLNRARRQGQVVSVDLDGRTKGYRLADKTPGDTAGTVPPGFVATERPGGDGHAAGPDSVPDHDQAFGGRDDRDHSRETETRPVTVDF